MDVGDCGWVFLVDGEKKCWLVTFDECLNSIQASSHSNAWITFTSSLVLSNKVAAFRSTGRSRRKCCDETARCQGTVFCSEDFEACHPNWRQQSWNQCNTLGHPNCKPWTIRSWQETNLFIVNPQVLIQNWNPYLVEPKRITWTSKTENPCGKIHLWGPLGVLGGQTWQLAWFSFGLEDDEGYNALSGQWHDTCLLNTQVDSLIFCWLRNTILPVLVNSLVEYSKLNKEGA